MLKAVFLVIYGVAVIAIGAVGFQRRVMSPEFSIANRQIRLLGTTLSIFATITTESVVFFSVSLTAFYGLSGSLSAVLGPTIGLLVMSLVVAKVHRLGSVRGHTCISEFCREQWGSVAGRVARWVMMAFLLWVVVLQLNLNGELMAALFQWSSLQATVIVVTLVLTYLLLGGYRAVVRTDVFQGILLACVAALPLVIEPKPDLARAFLEKPVTRDALLLFLMSLVLTIVRPEIWQRVYSAADARVARRALWGAAALNAAFGLLILYYAVAINQATPNLQPIEAFAYGYQTILPPAAAAAFPVFLLAAMMSSLDSAVFLFSINLARERDANSPSIPLLARLVMAAVLIGGGAASLFVFDALTFAYKLNGVMALFAVPIVLTIARPVEKAALLTAIGAGMGVYVLQVALGRIDTHPAEAVLGAVVGGGVLVVDFAWRRLLGHRSGG